ncbi:tetratricopeptide repeat protein [Vitiosangium sp. GDMCC 1.1324]|uniref:tetratricopeptide repeat protein n=1 Tax=Vitiosangium sp. (strain GDMCC 1.1324) TaxID=2138576 RepID=UPI000D378D10|nr:tetratricopeptide repeat protein [Vitiosangium sp. GDMCC 1.1324]PTL77132.1 sel1 repeat family protein [Vitiosangium sp. GDMCC 1.1324]
MVEQQEMTGKARHMDLEVKFNEASAHLDAGHHREAFRLFHEAARAGHQASWLNVGYCFDVGRGVRRSRERALFWYRKAVSKGDGAAANNIGTMYRDEGRPRLAARWFQKAVSLGDTGALLHLAKLYLGPLDDRAKARSALTRVARARDVTVCTQEEAEALLSQMQPLRKKGAS